MHYYIKNPNIILRNIHDIYFFIDVKANYYDDKCYLYEVNEMGVFIWNNLENVTSLESLSELLQQRLIEPVDLHILLEDLREFLEILCREGFVSPH